MDTACLCLPRFAPWALRRACRGLAAQWETEIPLSSAEALCRAAQSGFVLNTEEGVSNACVQDMWKKALQADLFLKPAFLYIPQRGLCTSECGGDKVFDTEL